jgi:hypothetical protein
MHKEHERDTWDRLELPPRRITPILALQALFGGARSQAGWFLVAIGPFFWFYVWHSDLSGWRFLLDQVVHTSGVSTGCEDSGFAVEGSEGERSPPIYQNHYRYNVNGKTLDGVAYQTSKCVRAGTVEVEYLRSEPDISRILDMRRQPLPAWLALLAIIPGTGFAVILGCLIKGRLRLRLLRIGLPAHGKLINKERRGTSDGPWEYVMTFEYQAGDGVLRRTTAKTLHPERLEDHPAETLLYDPGYPEKAILLDDLPGTVTLDEGGHPTGSSFECVFLPAITVLIYFWWYRLAPA